MLPLLVLTAPLLSAAGPVATPLVIDARMHHLRAGPTREWADFPAEAEVVIIMQF